MPVTVDQPVPKLFGTYDDDGWIGSWRSDGCAPDVDPCDATTVAPAGGENANVVGSIGSKLTAVNATRIAECELPRGNTVTESGTRVSASIPISTRPTSVADDRGSSTRT